MDALLMLIPSVQTSVPGKTAMPRIASPFTGGRFAVARISNRDPMGCNTLRVPAVLRTRSTNAAWWAGQRIKYAPAAVLAGPDKIFVLRLCV